MIPTRLMLRSRSVVVLVALFLAVFFNSYKHATAVKLDTTVLDATSDSSTPTGQPAYRMPNKIDEMAYAGGNETLRRLAIVDNRVEALEVKLETNEPEKLTIPCAKDNAFDTEMDCWNFIRVVEKTSSGDLLVCGTNAASRLCYSCTPSLSCSPLNANNTQLVVVPKNPDQNAAAAIFNISGQDILYGGGLGASAETFNRYSVEDLSADDPIELQLDTVTSNDLFINVPIFIGRPFEYGEYVFLLYRETAVEYTAGSTVYSRIARVCKNDTGGTTNTQKFATFIKARLACSIPNGDDEAFDYNFIQDAVWIPDEETVYAVFTSYETGPSTSALCQYRMMDIMNLFDYGNFREQDERDPNALWTEVTDNLNPRPGVCDEAHTTSYPPLLYKSVPSYNANERTGGFQSTPPDNFSNSDPPILYVDGMRFSSLAVDVDYTSPVFFVGTTDGSVIKFTSNECNGVDTITSVELQGFNTNGPVNGLELLKSSNSSATFLVGVSDFQSSIEWPLNTKCRSVPNEMECGLRFPYCNFTDAECTSFVDSVPQDITSTDLTEDIQITVSPNSSSVKACVDDYVFWFCYLDGDNPIVDSAQVTLTWEKTSGPASDPLSTTVISVDPPVVKLEVITHHSTKGMYNCTADVGGRIITKQVELTLDLECITQNGLCSRKEEYLSLKEQNEKLQLNYGDETQTCSVKQSDCTTCP